MADFSEILTVTNFEASDYPTPILTSVVQINQLVGAVGFCISVSAGEIGFSVT
jgi:hypothetical protein